MVSLDRIARAGTVNAHEETNATQNDAACFIMGFDGTVVTPHIRSLIANYGLGAVLVTEKNIVGRQIGYSVFRQRHELTTDI